MKEVKIELIEDFAGFVDLMEVNVTYLLPDNCRYKWVKIEKDTEYYSKETYFMWSMEYNYAVAGSVGYIYPLKGSNTCQHFKTEIGAKNNFIKAYSYYFDVLNKVNED